MSCESCQEMREVDDATPDCEIEGKACLIPPLCEDGRRIMEIYTTLRTLNGLVGPGTILSMYEAQRNDIEMLAIIEKEFQKAQKPVQTM